MNGLENFIIYLKSIQSDFESINTGYSIRYARKPSKVKKTQKKLKYKNDGLPPKIVEKKQKKTRGRPKKSTNKATISNQEYFSFIRGINTCFIDIIHEIFYWVIFRNYNFFWSFFDSKMKNNGLNYLLIAYKNCVQGSVEISAEVFRSWVYDVAKIAKKNLFGAPHDILSFLATENSNLFASEVNSFISCEKCTDVKFIQKKGVVEIFRREIFDLGEKVDLTNLIQKLFSGNCYIDKMECKCGEKTRKTWQLIISTCPVIFFELINCFDIVFTFEPTIFINDLQDRLSGIIKSTDSTGVHFTCDVLASPPGMLSGFYFYANDNVTGVSKFITNQRYDFLESSHIGFLIYERVLL